MKNRKQYEGAGRSRRRDLWKPLLVASALLLMAAGAVRAQAPAQGDGGWHYEADLFGWGAGLSGDVGPNIKAYQVDASFSDLSQYLDMGAMAHFEARKQRWGMMADAIYVNLGHSVDNRFGSPVKLNLEDMYIGLAGTFRIYEDPRSSFDFTFGARYNVVRADLTPHLLPARNLDLSWTDPVFGLKGGVRLGKIWTFGYRTDVGGFGAGSDFTCLAAFRLDAQVSRHVAIGFGYAYYKVDYETGSGRDDFTYNTAMHGPFVGVAWRW